MTAAVYVAMVGVAVCAILVAALIEQIGERRDADANAARLDAALARAEQANGGLVNELIKVSGHLDQTRDELNVARWQQLDQPPTGAAQRRQPRQLDYEHELDQILRGLRADHPEES